MNWNEIIGQASKKLSCSANKFEGPVTAEMISDLLAATETSDGISELYDADFSNLVFCGPADFSNVMFRDKANFDGTHFQDTSLFCHSKFHGEASFSSTKFERSANFAGAHFEDSFFFSLCEFGRHGSANFKKAIFMGDAHLQSLQSATFISFSEAQFEKFCSFSNFTADTVVFEETTFSGNVKFTDIKVLDWLKLNLAVFKNKPLHFNVGARVLEMFRTKLDKGGTFRLHGGHVEIKGLESYGSWVISSSRKTGDYLNIDKSLVVDGKDWKPKITRMGGTNVSQLTLMDVDLSECSFVETIGLDMLRFETECKFDTPPKGLYVGRSIPFIWWWSKRICITDERDWRGFTSRWSGWCDSRTRKRMLKQTKDEPKDEKWPQFQAERLAKVYRSLRKGREDVRNEPGAGDFYYGEMEMRRHGMASSGEKFLLWLYWIVSGYGLRPLRTIVALVVVSFLFAFCLASFGTIAIEDFTFLKALQVCIAATVNLEVVDKKDLNIIGQWLRIMLRVIGPTFYGIFLLAIRGRLKR